MQKKIDLKGKTLEELKEFAKSIGEQPYKGIQLFYWIYNRGVSNFDEMTDLSKKLRLHLQELSTINSIDLELNRVSKTDKTTKYLFRLSDGLTIESVLIPPIPRTEGTEEKRLTLCLSTQVGCPVNCVFCATGAMGFQRNLSAGEIVDQLLAAQRISSKKITNLVFMGMGEPMLNYENVMNAIDIISHERSIGISVKKTTISTVGYVKAIRRLADEGRKCKLAISLHSTVDDVRSKLVPIAKKHLLRELLDAVEYFYKKTEQRITFEYIVFRGLNDRLEDASRLIKITRRIPSKINLIPFHPIDKINPTGFAAELRPSSSEQIEEFASVLREGHVTVMVRSNAGEDIEAACGQLATLIGKS